MYNVKLTPDELLLLDGACSVETQAAVDRAKKSLRVCSEYSIGPKAAQLVAEVIATATTDKLLEYSSKRIRSCTICGENAGYVAFASGPKKGRENLDKPRYLRGIEMKRSFVSIDGHVSLGGCETCIKDLLPVLRAELETVAAELPEQLHADGAPRFKRWRVAECTVCGWTGHEGTMRPVAAILEGSYPGGCGECSASNKPLGQRLITVCTDRFVVTKIS